MEILCFYAGIVFILINKPYPLILLMTLFFFRPRSSLIRWFLAAISWCLIHQFYVSSRDMEKKLVIQNAELIGQIISIPVVQGDTSQFSFLVNTMNKKPVKTTVALACYAHCPLLRAGQSWRLIAKLKQPRNLGNPGGFNYVNWLRTRHIHWSGTVRSGSFIPSSIVTSPPLLLKIREHLLLRLAELDPDEKTLGIIQALTLGVGSHIEKSEWELFRHTGTIHLIDISGAHIGMIAGITYTVVCFLWSRMGLFCLLYPAPKIASIVALLIASLYTVIAGFAIPAQRALIACAFMLLRNFCSQRFTVWQAWRYALLSVLILEPHSVMAAGFYLSFIGVAILILINQRIDVIGFRKTMALQLACLAGLMPLTLFWFSYGAINGIVANIVAIPWVELWIVPLALLVTLLSSYVVIPGTMFLLKSSISLLLFFLNWVDSFAMVNLTFTFNQIASPLALMTVLALSLLLPIRRLFFPMSMMLIAALYPYHLHLKPGEAQIDIMDVGQGLAIAINTAHHSLLYDTGVKFFQGSDMAKIAIIPYLNQLGIKKLDKVIISHPDLDHRGGLKSLEERFEIQELVVDAPEFYHRGSPCHAYPAWEWDGVLFRFFSIAQIANSKNNHSCVLQLSTKSGKILFTGDIEKPAEDYLVSTYGNELASTFLVIPHHGSKTSSSSAFVEKVSPHYAIVSYGFDNRYHFPHQQTLRIYEQRQIPVINTVDCGMVTIKLTSKLNSPTPSCYLD
jgi:competence protein ComEC